MGDPICLVRTAATADLNTRCSLDGKTTGGRQLCENQGACVPLARPGNFSTAQVQPGPACTSDADCTGATPDARCRKNVCVVQPTTCTPALCATAANINAVNSGYLPAGSPHPLVASQFACGPTSSCVCAPGYTGIYCDQSTVATAPSPGGARCTVSTPGCDCKDGVCAACPPAWTGRDCGFRTSDIGAGSCRCADGWSGPTCRSGAFGGAEVWCRGNDQPQALAAYKMAQSVCTINQQFSGRAAQTPLIKDGKTIPCVAGAARIVGGATGLNAPPPPPPAGTAPLSSKSCADDTECPGTSNCVDAPAPTPTACSPAAPCPRSLTCTDSKCTCSNDADCGGGSQTCQSGQCVGKVCTALPCPSTRQCTKDADCPTNQCDVASGACRCGGAGQCGVGFGCDATSNLCTSATCGPADVCVPQIPLTDLPSAACDPVMMGVAEQGAVVGRLNLETPRFTRVPLPGAVEQASATTHDDRDTPNPLIPTTLRARPAASGKAAYPAVNLASTCGVSEVQLRNAIGTIVSADVAETADGSTTPFGGTVVSSEAHVASYVPPYPDRYCGDPVLW